MLLLAAPTYDGRRFNSTAIALGIIHSREPVLLRDEPSSLLAANVNAAWCQMLNLRGKKDITHFLLLHADVDLQHEPQWINILLDEMQYVGADVLAAVIPLKDATGITSTAIEGESLWAPRRFTLREIYSEKPATWTEPGLLINTGCMLVDVRAPWVEDICFTIKDDIIRDARGRFQHVVEGEDWNFSRQCHEKSLRVFATRKIPIDHVDGHTRYSNTSAWGTWTTDEKNREAAHV